jgi:hypothetical protein
MPLMKQGIFFSEEKKQKTLRVRAEPTRRDRSQNDQKLFASFSRKRRPSFLPSVKA